MLKSSIKIDDLYDNNNNYTECVNDRSAFFIQYSCEETIVETREKYEKLSMVSCIFCVVCVIYSLVIYYLKANTNIQVVKYDLDTVTAGDYTVEIEITEKMLHTFRDDPVWKDRIKDKGDAFALCFKKYLMLKIEKKMFECKTNRIQWLKK